MCVCFVSGVSFIKMYCNLLGAGWVTGGRGRIQEEGDTFMKSYYNFSEFNLILIK